MKICNLIVNRKYPKLSMIVKCTLKYTADLMENSEFDSIFISTDLKSRKFYINLHQTTKMIIV